MGYTFILINLNMSLNTSYSFPKKNWSFQIILVFHSFPLVPRILVWLPHVWDGLLKNEAAKICRCLYQLPAPTQRSPYCQEAFLRFGRTWSRQMFLWIFSVFLKSTDASLVSKWKVLKPQQELIEHGQVWPYAPLFPKPSWNRNNNRNT